MRSDPRDTVRSCLVRLLSTRLWSSCRTWPAGETNNPRSFDRISSWDSVTWLRSTSTWSNLAVSLQWVRFSSRCLSCDCDWHCLSTIRMETTSRSTSFHLKPRLESTWGFSCHSHYYPVQWWNLNHLITSWQNRTRCQITRAKRAHRRLDCRTQH